MNVEHLVQGNSSRSSGAKFVVDASFLDNYINTSSWLKQVRALDLLDVDKSLKMSHKKILEGILAKTGDKVVVKIADPLEDLKVEWDVYNTIAKCEPSIKGFINYFGFFTCKDTLARAIQDGLGDDGLCEGAGDTMQVLDMEYVNSQSMKRHDWSTESIDTLQSCIVQVVHSLLEAHLACGFVHGDMHLDNILLKKTKSGDNPFMRFVRCDVGVPKGNFEVSIVDLEHSKIGQKSPRKLFVDLKVLFSKCVTDLIRFVDIVPFQSCYRKVSGWIDDNQEDPMVVMELSDIIKNLTFVDRIYSSVGQEGGGAHSRDRIPRIAKKKKLSW